MKTAAEQIRNDPTDNDVRAVYGDWLQEEGGNPLWGEFIQASQVLWQLRADGRLIDPPGLAFGIETKPPHRIVDQVATACGLKGPDDIWVWSARYDEVTAGEAIPAHFDGVPSDIIDTVTATRFPDPERLGNRVYPRQITLTRGLLSAVRAPWWWCLIRLPEVLARWPLETVEVLDVPGLTLAVRPPDYEGDVWRFRGQLNVGPSRRTAIGSMLSGATRLDLVSEVKYNTDKILNDLLVRSHGALRPTLESMVYVPRGPSGGPFSGEPYCGKLPDDPGLPL